MASLEVRLAAALTSGAQPSPGTVARSLGIHRTQAQDIIRRLVKRGLVRLEVRSITAHYILTKQGGVWLKENQHRLSDMSLDLSLNNEPSVGPQGTPSKSKRQSPYLGEGHWFIFRAPVSLAGRDLWLNEKRWEMRGSRVEGAHIGGVWFERWRPVDPQKGEGSLVLRFDVAARPGEMATALLERAWEGVRSTLRGLEERNGMRFGSPELQSAPHFAILGYPEAKELYRRFGAFEITLSNGTRVKVDGTPEPGTLEPRDAETADAFLRLPERVAALERAMDGLVRMLERLPEPVAPPGQPVSPPPPQIQKDPPGYG